MAFEAYRVAVEISAVNLLSPQLSRIAAEMSAADKAAVRYRETLASIGKLVMAGGLLAGTGLVMLGALKAPLEAASRFEQATARFKTLNLGEDINRQAVEFAKAAKVWGTSSTELVDAMSESIGLFNDFDLAKRLTPLIAELNKANSLLFSGKVDKIDEGTSRSVMKFIDRLGLNSDEASFRRGLDLAQKIVTGSGGSVKFRDLANFSQYAGTALRGLSDEGLLKMASLLQEQGGARAGTAFMSMYQNLIAGRTPKKTLGLLQDFGLMTLEEKRIGSVGDAPARVIESKTLKEAGLFQADPVGWFQKVFLPALAAKGITKEADIIKTTNDLLSQRTASGQASIMSAQLMTVLRDYEVTRRAMGAQETIGAAKQTTQGLRMDAAANWDKILMHLGNATLPIVNRALQVMIPYLERFAAWLNANPAKVETLTKAFIGLAGALVFGGTVLLLTAAFKGLALALSMSGMVTGLTAALRGLGVAMSVIAPASVAAGGALATLGAAIGRFAAVAAAAAAGWMAGKWIDKNYVNPAYEELMRRNYEQRDPNAPHVKIGGKAVPVDQAEKYIHEQQQKQERQRFDSMKSGGPPLSFNILMDGHKVGQLVTRRQAREAGLPPAGGSVYDGSMSLIPVAVG